MKFSITTLLMILTQMMPASSTAIQEHRFPIAQALLRYWENGATIYLETVDMGFSKLAKSQFGLACEKSILKLIQALEASPPSATTANDGIELTSLLPNGSRGITILPKNAAADGPAPSQVSQDRAQISLHIVQTMLQLSERNYPSNGEKLKACHEYYRDELGRLGWTVGAEASVDSYTTHTGYSVNTAAIEQAIIAISSIGSPAATVLVTALRTLKKGADNNGYIPLHDYNNEAKCNSQLIIEVSARDVDGRWWKTENVIINVYAIMIRSKDEARRSVWGYKTNDLEYVVKAVTLECSPQQWHTMHNDTVEFERLSSARTPEIIQQAWNDYVACGQRRSNFFLR